MWVGLTISVCLHSQEVEEDPQRARKSPEMWLTALAANPVHLLSKDGVLKGTHMSMSAQVEKRMVERGPQGKFPGAHGTMANEVLFLAYDLKQVPLPYPPTTNWQI